MKRTQIFFISGGILLLALLLFFGTTVSEKEIPIEPPKMASFDIQNYLTSAKSKLTASQLSEINRLEKMLSENNAEFEKVKALDQLAKFWDDSLHNREAAVFYVKQSASLVNSEKNLTFAARQILGEVRRQQDNAKRIWEADLAIQLFEKAIALNPMKDSLKVELASCYIFGKGMGGDAQETMKGVQKLLQIVRTDSSNMQAQLVLGIGGVLSTQYEKAIQRLELVVKKEPTNLEAVSWLADAYAAKGDKQNAIRCYNYSKLLVNDPRFSNEVDERIKSLSVVD